MKRSDELKQERAQVIDSAQAVLDVAQSEGRELDSAESGRFNALMAKADTLATSIDETLTNERNLAALRAAKADMNKISEPNFPGQHGGLHGGQPQVSTPKLVAFKGSGSREQAARDAYDCGLWMKANVLRGEDSASAREKLISRRGESWVASQNETSPTDGGYLVPAPMSAAIIVSREQVSAVRKLATIIPMTADTLGISKQTAGNTVYYPGEEGEITPSDADFAKVNLAVKKRAVLTYVSAELKDDAIVPVMDLVVQNMGHSLGLKEDQEGIVGDGTSAYGGVHGIRPKVIAATASVSQAGTGHDTWAELDISDFAGCMSKLSDLYRVPGQLSWLCSAAFKWQVMDRLAIGSNGALSQQWIDGVPQEMFLGYPIVLSDRMPTSGAAATVAAIFGNFPRAVLLGDRTGVRVAISEHVAFTTDRIALRATTRYDINVHEAGDTSTAGAIAGLKTAA